MFPNYLDNWYIHRHSYKKKIKPATRLSLYLCDELLYVCNCGGHPLLFWSEKLGRYIECHVNNV